VTAAQSQRDLALADYKRFEALKNQGFISAAELERRETVLKAAESALTQAQSQHSAQSNQAAYARLLATASGVVTGIEAEVGQVLAAGQPVVRLAHDGPREAVFAVPEQMAQALKPGQVLQAHLPASAQSLQGRVREVGAAADPVTRTFQVKLALDASEKLPLGATVSVQMPKFAASPGSAIKLPTAALRQEGQGTAVWVLDESSMTVQSRAVTVQAVDGQEAVITSGLQGGEKVVAAGVHVLSPGQKVTVYAPATSAK
jgi:multidrug efflux system membrane fusion protein